MTTKNAVSTPSRTPVLSMFDMIPVSLRQEGTIRRQGARRRGAQNGAKCLDLADPARYTGSVAEKFIVLGVLGGACRQWSFEYRRFPTTGSRSRAPTDCPSRFSTTLGASRGS